MTLKVVPGITCGANFSALLLFSYGMDHDGDHGVFIAVTEMISAQIQESLLGPHNKMFSETGHLTIAPTFWPLDRWSSLLEGIHTSIPRVDAMRILSAAGRVGHLNFPENISGCDLLACLLEVSLRDSSPLHVGPEKRLIWNGGEPIFGGKRCSFQVPACAGRGWEYLTLIIILLLRKQARHTSRRENQLCLRPEGFRTLKPWKQCSLKTARVHWAVLLLRMHYAMSSARFPSPDDLLDLIVVVARTESTHAALELATNIQLTGYLICPTLQAACHPRSHLAHLDAVELCVDLFNLSWDFQPPNSFPRGADSCAQIRRKGLSEPCKRVFDKVVTGLHLQERCGVCSDCKSKDENNGTQLNLKSNYFPLCVAKTLADIGVSVLASLVAHHRISALRSGGFANCTRSPLPCRLPPSALIFFEAQDLGYKSGVLPSTPDTEIRRVESSTLFIQLASHYNPYIA